ncbi:MAG: sensor histidine kinase [Sarcina sp.]
MKERKIKSLKYRMIFPAIIIGIAITAISLIFLKCCFDEAFTHYMRANISNNSFSTQGHLAFLNLVAEIVAMIGIMLLVSYIIIGVLLSKAISNPLKYIEHKAQDIIDGNLNKDIKIDTNIEELRSLTDTINTLSADLREQERVRKQFTSDIAHEIRTPITNVKSHLEAIIDGVWEPTPERLGSIKDEVERLSQIVVEFRQLCSYDDKRIILNKINVNLNKLIERNVESFSGQLLEKNIKVTIKGEEVFVNVDRNKMSQVFVNLISNAIRYSNIGGTIDIKIEQVNEKGKVEITDQGIGIGKQHIPYIFERLYRTDESRTRATGGSGIGLTITKSIVNAHGGKISVESEEGVGSTFTISGL